MSYLALQGPLGALGADVQSLQNQLALAKTQVGTLRSQTATYRPYESRSAVQRRRGFGLKRSVSDTPKTVTWGKIYDLKKGGNVGFEGLHRYPRLSPNVATIVSAIDTAKANVKALEEQIKRAKASESASPQPTSLPEVSPLEVPAVGVPESSTPGPSAPSTPGTSSPSTPGPSAPTQPPQMTPPVLPQTPLHPGPTTPVGKKGLNKGLLFGGAAAVAVVAGMFLLGD